MREYLLVLLTAAATTYLFSGLARRVAIKVGAVAPVRDRDVHQDPIPYLGGVAMLVGVFAAFLLASRLPFLGEHAVVSHDAQAILLAGAVICLVGVIDDIYDLSALTKTAGQVLAAGIVVLNGVRAFWIALPNRIIALDPATSILVTVAFIFLCANAINFVDGLDGLASGVVAIGSLALFSYTYLLAYEQDLVLATTASLVSVTIAGVCIGFLPHNFFPARMFMGDSGALLLGLLMASSTLSLTGQFDSGALRGDQTSLLPAYMPLLLPIAIMFLPFLDLAMAYARRTMAGTWWFVADKQHLHHRLLELGHSQRRAALVMYTWSALISFGLIAIVFTGKWWMVAVVLVLGLILAALTWYPDRGQSPESASTETGSPNSDDTGPRKPESAKPEETRSGKTRSGKAQTEIRGTVDSESSQDGEAVNDAEAESSGTHS